MTTEQLVELQLRHPYLFSCFKWRWDHEIGWFGWPDDSKLAPDASPLFAEGLLVTEEIELPEPGQPRQGPGLGEYFLKNMKD